jgi:hypothetical protein
VIIIAAVCLRCRDMNPGLRAGAKTMKSQVAILLRHPDGRKDDQGHKISENFTFSDFSFDRRSCRFSATC